MKDHDDRCGLARVVFLWDMDAIPSLQIADTQRPRVISGLEHAIVVLVEMPESSIGRADGGAPCAALFACDANA